MVGEQPKRPITERLEEAKQRRQDLWDQVNDLERIATAEVMGELHALDAKIEELEKERRAELGL